MKKKLLKFTVAVIAIFMVSFLVYRNFVYYLIPFNPIKEYCETAPYSVSGSVFTENENVHLSTDEYNTEYNDQIIVDYFKNLNLVPLTHDEYRNEVLHVNFHERVYYHIGFEDIGTLYIGEVFLDNMSVISIRGGNIPHYNQGYFKVYDGELDYRYVNKLIKGEVD